jgi:uncharacterized surface protein with fasciclin (FAS1) repeats
MKKIITILVILASLITACTNSFIGTQYIDKNNANLELSNAEFLQKNNEKYSLWIELLKHANMYNALNDASANSTVFAPNNEAVQKFLTWKGVSSVQDLDKEYARNVAKVHIMKGVLKENDFIAKVNTGSIPVMTLFGSYLTTSYGYKNLEVNDDLLDKVVLEDSLSIYLNNQAKVANHGRADTTANGTVYTLDEVIRPLSETILDVLGSYKEYSIFIEAAKKTGYDKVVSVYADTVLNINGSISVNDVRFTCFAVPNEVYAKAGINSANDLVAYLHAGTDFESQQNGLYQYVAYHFMGKSYLKSVLTNFKGAGDVMIYDTKLTGKVITTQMNSGNLVINGAASIIRSNIKARNGIIHKIDNIMQVYDPSPTKVVWDFCNAPDVESFVNAYGASLSLGQLFSTGPSNKEYQIDLSTDKLEGNWGNITTFQYLPTAVKSSTKSWRRIGFFKCSYLNSTDLTHNKYGAYMDNLLILNLGYAGYITMKTPTLIKGKYKVVIYYAGAPGLKTYYTNGSNTRFNLDDYQKSIFMWKGIPGTFVDDALKTNINANGIASEILWDQITFDASGSHTLKATMMDINAKTSSSYRQMWDRIEFIPIIE